MIFKVSFISSFIFDILFISMNKKTIILDFDYTLFDAKKFRKDLVSCLACFDIDEKLYTKTYNKIRYRGGKEADYLPIKHLKHLARLTNNNYQDLKKEYDKVIDKCIKYLYSDVLLSLKKLQATSYKLILLTFGNPEFQKMKIDNSKIKKYFNKIYYTDKNKTDFVKEIPDNENMVFINDNPNEIVALQKIYKKAKFIQIQRIEGKKYSLKIKKILIIKNLFLFFSL